RPGGPHIDVLPRAGLLVEHPVGPGDRAVVVVRDIAEPSDALVLAPGQDVAGALRGLDVGDAVALDAVGGRAGDLGDAAEPVGDRDVAEAVDRGSRGAADAVGPNDVAAQLGAGLGVDLGDRALPRVGDPDQLLDWQELAVVGAAFAVAVAISVAISVA